MKFREVKGKKKDGDKILLGKTDGTDGWEAIRLIDVARMVAFKYENENLLYPPPKFRGGEMVLDFLKECIKEPDDIERIAWQFKLRRGIEAKLHFFV